MNSCLENVLFSGDRLQLNTRPPVPAATGPITVWLVDDDARVRDLLASLLNREGEIDCSRIFPNAEAALQALAREAAPDVMLVDLHLGAEDGVNVAGKVKRLARGTCVFVISTFYDSHHETRALGAGALGFVPKHDVERMVRCIRRAGPVARVEGAVAGN